MSILSVRDDTAFNAMDYRLGRITSNELAGLPVATVQDFLNGRDFGRLALSALSKPPQECNRFRAVGAGNVLDLACGLVAS